MPKTHLMRPVTAGSKLFTANCLALAATLLVSAALTGCSDGGSAAAPDTGSPAPRSLGLMSFTISGVGSGAVTGTATLICSVTDRMAAKKAMARYASLSDYSSGIDAEFYSGSTLDIGTRGTPGAVTYVYATYKIRNAQYCTDTGNCTPYTSATHNLTLLAVESSTNTLGASGISQLLMFDGSSYDAATAASIAQSMKPTQAVAYNGSGVYPVDGLQSFQVFTESEVSGISAVLPSGYQALPYGFVVKNVNSDTSRALPANPASGEFDGLVTFAYQLPQQASASEDPYAITASFEVVDDTNVRVSQGIDEENSTGDATEQSIANLLNANDLSWVDAGRVRPSNIGQGICTVRTAGTAASPSAYLVNNSASLILGSAPYNLQNVAPTAPVSFGFCDSIGAPPAGSAIVSGGQSGAHAGTWSGSGTGQLSFTPTNAFTPGEPISFSLTTALQSSDGTSTLASPFVGSLLAGGLIASTASYTAQTAIPVGAGAVALVVGDFYNDGNPDLAIAAGSSIYILHGNGAGAFTSSSVTAIGEVAAIAIGDFNGDGNADLVVGSAGNSQHVVVLFGNGQGGFPTQTVPAVGQFTGGIAVGDFNGDGIPDLAVTNEGNNNVSILIGTGAAGAGVFNPANHATVGVGSEPFGVAVGDFNGDGKLDLAVANFGSNSVSILLGNGNGTFTPASPATVGVGSGPKAIAAGDFNGDGKTDLAVSNGNDGTVSILQGNGQGGFTVSDTITVGTNPMDVVTGDFNGDGNLDLAVANSGPTSASPSPGTVTVLLGYGAGGFTAAAAHTYTVGKTPYAVAVGNIYGSGKQAIAVVNNYDNTVQLLKQ